MLHEECSNYPNQSKIRKSICMWHVDGASGGWRHECSQKDNIVQIIRLCKILFQVTASTVFQLS